MRDVRELSAKTGESMRWFIYILALVMPWISLGILGPWLAVAVSCAAIVFWLWWVLPPIGLNRRPGTYLLSLGLIIACSLVVLIAEYQLQVRTGRGT